MTLALIAITQRKAVIAADRRELHEARPIRDDITKIYPAGTKAAAILTGHSGFTAGGRSISFTRLMMETLNAPSISERDLLSRARAVMNVIGPEFEFFIRLDPSWTKSIDRDVLLFVLVGPDQTGIGICGFRMDFNPDYSAFSWTPVDKPAVLKLKAGDVHILSFGRNAIFHELFEGSDPRLDGYRNTPAVKKYREKLLSGARHTLTEREIHSLLRKSIEATEREWVNFYQLPVEVHRPLDIAQVDREFGFRWITKGPRRYTWEN